MKILSATWGEIVVESESFCRFLQKIGGSSRTPRAAVVWPFLVVRDQQEFQRPWLINHEKIHLAQNTDLLVIGLDVLYVAEYVFARLVLRKSKEEAYYWFSHEQEAYRNQHNLDYLKTRRWGAQFKYIFDKKRFRVTDAPGELEYY